jgi:hypothetical protein
MFVAAASSRLGTASAPSQASVSIDASKLFGNEAPNVAAAAVIAGLKSRYERVVIGRTIEPSFAP